jgi:hypothetical protein
MGGLGNHCSIHLSYEATAVGNVSGFRDSDNCIATSLANAWHWQYATAMANEAKFDPGLSRIMVICLTLGFTVLFASMEALRVTQSGFAFSVTWRTALALVIGAMIVGPCFYTLVYPGSKITRKIAIFIIVAIGVTGFFYPLRFVPREKMGSIFGGLALAICALSMVAGFVYMLHRFLSNDEQEGNK